jgi:hypothetical protein
MGWYSPNFLRLKVTIVIPALKLIPGNVVNTHPGIVHQKKQLQVSINRATVVKLLGAFV